MAQGVVFYFNLPKYDFSTNLIKLTTFFLIFLLLMLILINVVSLDTKTYQRFKSLQLYSPSKGGIASVKEAGDWIKNNSKESDIIWQSCGSEMLYYSNREVIGSFEYYFLNEFELNKIMKDQNVKYIVIFDSQIVENNKWNNLCWVPISFSQGIKKNFIEVYKTSYSDISIYTLK